MCQQALPPGFKDEQTGDWANIWPLKYIKPSLTAFGYRADHWPCKWREMPITLFALFGPGESRWETTDGRLKVRAKNKTVWFHKPNLVYLSAIQYWTTWSVQIGWPLFFAFHFKLDGVIWYFRIGARRNAEGFFDFPSIHLGDFN